MASDSSRSASDGNIKETIESILVAFILAFVFRAFVVEAFVIPTGSMAPTLYGAHMRLKCPDCGYLYDVNWPNPRGGSGDDPIIPSDDARRVPYRCPNCGYTIPPSPQQTLADNTREPVLDQPVRFGDRILVLKYLYLFQEPNRWDVVVFKAPVLGPQEEANDAEYGQNYIKRLAGKPNESLVILDGAVYTGSYQADVQWGEHGQVIGGADQFTIQRRPEYVRERLWRTVYDNDFLPHLNRSIDATQDSWTQPWKSDGSSGWQTTDSTGRPSRTFTFNSSTASGTLHFDPEANSTTYPLTDWLAYDQLEHSRGWRPQHVGDLKLHGFYTRESGDGALSLQLTKRDDCFTARLTPGHVALYKSRIVNEDPFQVTDEVLVGQGDVEVPALAKLGAPVEVTLENVDYQVSVGINGRKVDVTTDAQYKPDMPRLFNEAVSPQYQRRSQVRVIADKQSSKLEHLLLARNIYYLNTGGRHTFWASPRQIVHLGPGEYFVLGDNSAVSLDARWWDVPVNLPAEGLDVLDGRVPARFMLGKAFFVYWPAGYRPTQLLPFGVVPDFGEMRFIH